MKHIISLVAFISMLCLSARGQSVSPDVIATSGGEFSTANTTLSFTIGEPMIQTYSSASSQVTEGFHQPYYEINSIEELNETDIDVVLTQNPSTEKVFLNVRGNDRDLAVVIYNINGKRVGELTISGSGEFPVDLGNRASSMYVIHVLDTQGSYSSTHKLIKH